MEIGGYNYGNRELHALRNMLSNDADWFKAILDNDALDWATLRGRNLVVETLAPELTEKNEDHVAYVLQWIDDHEGQMPQELVRAFHVLDKAGLGNNKRKMLDDLADERERLFKAARTVPK